MDHYNIIGRVGEGAHGIVFKAKHIQSGEIVALKRVSLKRLEDEIPNTVLREIKALQAIEENENVVKLLDVFAQGINMLRYLDNEITKKISSKIIKSHTKCLSNLLPFFDCLNFFGFF